MAVSITTVKVDYNFGEAPYTITFDYTNASEVKVLHIDTAGTQTAYTSPTNYSISGTAVVLVTPLISGEVLWLYRESPLTQGVNLLENVELPVESIEEQLDKVTRTMQELGEKSDRSLKVGLTESNPNVLPAAEDGKLLQWSSGSLVNVTFASPAAALASQAEAFAGTDDLKYMSPLKVREASVYTKHRQITAGTTLLADDEVIDCAQPSGNITVVLPTGASIPNGKKFTIYKNEAEPNFFKVTINDGTRFWALHLGSESATFIKVTDTQYQMISHSAPNEFVDFSGQWSWSSTGTAPAIGNGNLDLQAKKHSLIAEGLTTYSYWDVRVHILFGSTTTVGTGDYFFGNGGGSPLSHSPSFGNTSANFPFIVNGNGGFYSTTDIVCSTGWNNNVVANLVGFNSGGPTLTTVGPTNNAGWGTDSVINFNWYNLRLLN